MINVLMVGGGGFGHCRIAFYRVVSGFVAAALVLMVAARKFTFQGRVAVAAGKSVITPRSRAMVRTFRPSRCSTERS